MPFLLCILLVLQASWELRRERDGISMYTREVQGSRYREVKAVMELDHSMEKVYALLEDIPGQQRWMADMVEVRLLEDDPVNPVQYSRIRAPRPVQDRDVVIITRVERQAGRIIRHFESATHRDAPSPSNVVRIDSTRGSWQLDSLAPARTRVTYINHAEPGGSLPAWLVNRQIMDQPFESMRGMREELRIKN